MKDLPLKDIITWVIVGLILLFVIITFFKIPNNLKSALSHVDSAQAEIDESIQLLRKQQSSLDSVIRINKALLAELEIIRSKNDTLSSNIKKRFDTAHRYLYDILTTVDKIPTVEDPD